MKSTLAFIVVVVLVVQMARGGANVQPADGSVSKSINEDSLLPFQDISVNDIHGIFSVEYDKTRKMGREIPIRLRGPLEQAVANVLHFAFHGDTDSCRAIYANMQFFCKGRVIASNWKVSQELVKVIASSVAGVPFQRFGFLDPALTIRKAKFRDIFPELAEKEGSKLLSSRMSDTLTFVTVWGVEKITPSKTFPHPYRCSRMTFICDPADNTPVFYFCNENSTAVDQLTKSELHLYSTRNNSRVSR